VNTTPIFLLAAASLGAFALSLALTGLVMAIAPRIGFVDRPGGHKSHRRPVPYGGGVAIFLSVLLPLAGVLAAAQFASPDWLAEQFSPLVRDLFGGVRERSGLLLLILGGAGVMFGLGLIDDVRPLGPYVKLAANLGVALAVAGWSGVRLAEFAGVPASTILTVAWIVVIANTFNFLDNMDGLSAGVAAICAGFFIVCGLLAGQWLAPGLASVVLGAVLGFWVFNFPPARIFMGDAGSLAIGYLLAVISIVTSYWDSGAGARPFALAMPLCILAVPLYDFLSVVVIRLFEGRNPLRGDQRHFSHRLVDRGLTRAQAVLTIYLACATTGLGATLLPRADLRGTLTILLMVGMVLAIVAILEAPLRKKSE
jgi:UDP-GlcNAc:undecaprenyl-phosphate GlcNAc-1-phosphate transferase